MRTAVWAYKRLPELSGAVGVVHCDAHVAKALLDSGDVQDLRQGRSLKRIEACYETKVMTPGPVVGITEGSMNIPPDAMAPNAIPQMAKMPPKANTPKAKGPK